MRLTHLTLPCLALAIDACSPPPAVLEERIRPQAPESVAPVKAPLVNKIALPQHQASVPEKVAVPHPILIQPNGPKLTPQEPISLQRKITSSYQKTLINDVTLSLVSFDDRDYQLRVADQEDGPGSQWTNAQSAAAEYNGIAAINAGFFTPEGNPLGILVEDGIRRGSLNSSSLGAGMIHFSPTSSSIFRKGSYSAAKHNNGNLIQTGPMLAENSSTISGLSKTNSRHRSFIAWDKNHHWIIGYASPCTLDELSQAIAGRTLAGVKIHTAINLDGGRSSDLWVGKKVSNGGKTHRTFINKPVRNYLVLINR